MADPQRCSLEGVDKPHNLSQSCASLANRSLGARSPIVSPCPGRSRRFNAEASLGSEKWVAVTPTPTVGGGAATLRREGFFRIYATHLGVNGVD